MWQRFTSSCSALSSGSLSSSGKTCASLIRPCLSCLTAICCSLTLAGCLSPNPAYAETVQTLPEMVSESLTEAVTEIEQSEEPSETDTGSDSGSGEPVAEPAGESPERPSYVAVVDVSPEVRAVDYEAPQSIEYVGLGLCLGALLGSAFTRGFDYAGYTGGISRE